MKKSAITYDEVVRAAIQILREGQNISKPLIRERLGNRGSHTTIQKNLDGWRESLTTSDLEVLPPSMPPELMPHIEALWNASTAMVEDKLASEWVSAKQSVEDAERVRDVAHLEKDKWKDFARDKESELTGRESEIVHFKERLASLEDRLRIRDQEYQAAVDRLTEKDRAIEGERDSMKQKIELLESRHTQAMKAAESRWDAEIEKLQEQTDAAKERAQLEIRRSDSHEVYFLNEVAKARDETDRVREKSEQEVKRIEQELTITRKREESSSVRLGQMEERLMATQDQADGLTADKEELLSELATAKEDKARLEKENLRLNQAIEQNGKEE